MSYFVKMKKVENFSLTESKIALKEFGIKDILLFKLKIFFNIKFSFN